MRTCRHFNCFPFCFHFAKLRRLVFNSLKFHVSISENNWDGIRIIEVVFGRAGIPGAQVKLLLGGM